MPSTLQVADVGDVIRGTLKQLHKDKWTNLSTDLQKFVAAKELVNDHKMKEDGGTSLQFNLMIGTNGQARATGLYEVDNVQQVDVMTQGDIPWRHMETKMTTEERLISMNRNNAVRVYDTIKTGKASAWMDWMEKFENFFWSKPATSADVKTPYGVKMYIVATNAASTFGFNGGNPAGFTSGVAGLDSTLVPRWRNGSALFTNPTKDDFLPKLKEAATKCYFISAVDMPEYGNGKGPGYYTGYRVKAALDVIMENANDRLGSELDSMHGKTTFRGTPITWVPRLDDDATDPFYGINWSHMGWKYLEGEWMKQRGPFRAPLQHTAQWTFWDTSMNLYCDDRRSQFILTK